MLKAIVSAQRGKPVTDYPGLPPVKHGMIAVPQACQDERGYSLNHQQRILNRLAKVGVKSDTHINFVLMELKHITVESIRFATIVAKANGTANEQAHVQAHEEAHEEAQDMEYGEANARRASEQTDSVAYEHNEAQPTQDGDRATLETTGLTGRVWQFVKAKVTSAN